MLSEYPTGRELVFVFYVFQSLAKLVYLDPTVGDVCAGYTGLVLSLFSVNCSVVSFPVFTTSFLL